MKYQVIARKYRPQLFSEVVGQEAIVTTLKNAIHHDRIAHAYLFCGLRGTGKTTLARILAKALNCSQRSPDGEPCNQCSSCKEISTGHAIDVLEIDGASHRGIEDIRQINETIGFMPSAGHYKIYLIDEVHMLTKEAFNALLKTLEEPPAHAKFFFATTEAHKIPATILSRCQRFNLGRIPSEKIQAKLVEVAADFGISVEAEALFTIAELAEGSLRDAESLFDQVIAFQSEKITLNTVIEVLGLPSRDLFFALDAAENYTVAFDIAKQVFGSGKNLSYFLEELILHFRTLFLLKQGVPYRGRDEKRYLQSVERYRIDQLLQILEYLTEAQQTLKHAVSERTTLEMLLLRILRTRERISLESLVKRLVALESHNSSPSGAATVPPSPKPIEKAPVSPTKVPLPPKETISVSEDPTPKPEELPTFKPKKTAPASKPPAPQPKAPPKKPEPPLRKVDDQREQSRYDTVMRFAAKELHGFLKKA